MAITIPLKKKHSANKPNAPKHGYRTRTGPNCCNGGCAAHPPQNGSGIKYSARLKRRYNT